LTEQNQKSIRSFAEKISKADALVLPGGYDLNDQPDGVAKDALFDFGKPIRSKMR